MLEQPRCHWQECDIIGDDNCVKKKGTAEKKYWKAGKQDRGTLNNFWKSHYLLNLQERSQTFNRYQRNQELGLSLSWQFIITNWANRGDQQENFPKMLNKFLSFKSQ